MTRLLAIDPGAVHCGLAVFVGNCCTDACECDPQALLAVVRRQRALSELVVEEFRLYPDTARSLAYDPLATVELIGALRYIAERRAVPVVMQPASIRRPAAAMVKRRGIMLQSKNDHAKDAELHGWYRLFTKGDETG